MNDDDDDDDDDDDALLSAWIEATILLIRNLYRMKESNTIDATSETVITYTISPYFFNTVKSVFRGHFGTKKKMAS